MTNVLKPTREDLGRLVHTQMTAGVDPAPSWEALSEDEKEVARRAGVAAFRMGYRSREAYQKLLVGLGPLTIHDMIVCHTPEQYERAIALSEHELSMMGLVLEPLSGDFALDSKNFGWSKF